MILIRDAPKVDQILAHLDCSFGHLGKVGVVKTEFPDGFLHLGIEQGVATMTLEFLQDAHPVYGDPFGTPHLDQQIE